MASNLSGLQSSTTKSSVLHRHTEERTRLVNEYFERTKLLQVVEDFMSNLATSYKAQLRLPVNPYPELLKVMRMHEVRQAFTLQGSCTSSSLLQLTVLNSQTSTPSQFQVCSVEDEQFALPIWGVRPFLEQLTGANLYSLLGLVSSAFQGLVLYNEFRDDDCLATGYGVLVGDSTLGSQSRSILPCFLELETHMCVSGQHLEKSMAVFARFLMKQLHEAANAATVFASLPPDQVLKYSGCIICEGIVISPISALEYKEPVVWRIERVKESRVAFVNAVKTALVSNSQISLTRFDSAQLPDFDGAILCEVEQTFYFHFNVVKGGKTSSRRSFLSGSQALSTGLFFHPQGALEITAGFQVKTQAALNEEGRKQKLQKKKHLAAPIVQSDVTARRAKPRTGFVDVLRVTLDKLRQIGLSSEKFRHQADCLVSCFAYELGQLVAAHQVLQSLLSRSNCSASMAILAQARFQSLETQMKRFMEEAKEAPPTSVLFPIWFLAHQLYSDAKTKSAVEDERQISDFVEALGQVIELLLVVVRITFADFLRLVRTTTETASATVLQPEHCATSDEIDVVRALEVAVEEHKYPPSIVLEAVFAQAIMDSWLDVALESAVMNTIAIHLPPNPFIDMSTKLQVFALRQLVWRHEAPTFPEPKMRTLSITKLVELVIMEVTGVCSVNPRLFQLVGCNQFPQIHRWLTDQQILYDGNYKPSNSSYSVVIIPMLLIFHPLLLAKENLNSTENFSLLEEVDIMEHYIVQGKDLAQARLFFMDAVHRDLRRIIAACGSFPSTNSWVLQAKALVVDPRGQSVAEFPFFLLTPDDILAGIVEESSRPQVALKLVVEIAEVRASEDNGSLIIHKVSKIYAFHHQSTEETVSGSPTQLSRLMTFQVFEYGVFCSKENALLCLKNMEFGQEFAGISRDAWTPFSSEGFCHDDKFLIFELDAVHSTSRCSCPQQCRDNESAKRLTVHSSICQLYNLEQAIRWLQSSLQQPLLSKTRNVNIYSGLPPAKVFTIQHRLALQIITHIEQLVVPLNHQLQYLDEISGPLATLRECVDRWQAIQPPTEEQLDIQRKQPNKTQEIFPTPRSDPILTTTELVNSLRTIWALVVFFRFSYQRAFFANAGCRRGN
ncbi:hypothetical protein DVH05_026565 [Phytophthora capsici]|nr:hypothetical protein DVH05_026565 [Phytophthora capsici]